MSKAVGIYNVYGIQNESKIVINHKENVYPKENEKINDILCISKYKIIDDVYGEIYACNLTDSFLLSTKTLPVLYVSVTYQRALRCVLLYRIYLYFSIEDDIKSSEELIGSPINGKFSMKIFMNGSEQPIGNNIDSYVGNEEIYNKFKTFTTADEMKELTTVMVEEILEKFSEMYKDERNSFEVPSNIISLKNYKVDEEE